MQIVINDNGIITAYAKIGKLKNGVDFFGDFPADFALNKYKWQALEPVISEDGEEEAVPCCIIRKERIEEKSTDEYGEEITVERIDSITEYGEIILNPDYVSSELSTYRDEAIKKSKVMLAQWLEDNPLLYSDGKYYSVTEEKQSLLNSNLASYERATQAGIEYPLKWNSTGAECELWSYADLLALSLHIAGYVAPKVSMQQSYEIRIKNCSSIEEIDSIVIDYDRNGDESETNS